MHPALLWKKPETTAEMQEENIVLCRLCNHFCRIEHGERGRCGVRHNVKGELFTLVADRVAALNLDPVEKKPLYHFYPGTQTFSLGTMGCNFRCTFCQNASLSQPPNLGKPIQGRQTTPQQLVEQALEAGAHSISYTYSEPTVFFELMYATAREAVRHGLKNILVSNGYQSPECLKMLAPYIHAANIDLKSFSNVFYRDRCGASLKPVLNTLKHIKELGWWLEVTTLIIPELNDTYDELAKLAVFIHDELGADTPWHISRFHPDYKMQDRKHTPTTSLELAWDLGREAGLNYVYIGNAPGHEKNSTFCPSCGEELIHRKGFHITNTMNQCPSCQATVAGVGMDYKQGVSE